MKVLDQLNDHHNLAFNAARSFVTAFRYHLDSPMHSQCHLQDVQHGQVDRWYKDRKFGFIKPMYKDEKLFVHHTSLLDDRRHLTVGEQVIYISEPGRPSKRDPSKQRYVAHSVRVIGPPPPPRLNQNPEQQQHLVDSGDIGGNAVTRIFDAKVTGDVCSQQADICGAGPLPPTEAAAEHTQRKEPSSSSTSPEPSKTKRRKAIIRRPRPSRSQSVTRSRSRGRGRSSNKSGRRR